MNLLGVLKMAWNKISGKDISAAVSQHEAYFETWLSVYKGCPSWLEYSYPTLSGRMQKRIRKTMKPAKMLCSEIAGLVWAERPAIDTAKEIETVLDDNGFWKSMQRETELMLALGAMVPKLYVKDSKIGIDYVRADRFIPVTWDSSGIHEADILDRRVIHNKNYVRVEKHRKNGEGYTVTSEVYEDAGGTMVPATLTLFGIENAKATSPVKMFFYIGTPEANNLDTDSPLSISTFANALDIIEAIDMAFDGLNSEIILGKKRIIVPTGAIRMVTNVETGEKEKYFDPSDEVFQAFTANDKEDLKITDNTVELRIEDIRRAIQTLLDIFALVTGLNPGAISFDSAGMKTATEVISENSKTFKTKQSYENAIGDGIVQMLQSIRGLLVYLGQPVSGGADTISWDDSVIEDRNSKTAYIHGRLAGRTMTKYQAIMELDGVDEETAKARAEEIKAETATVDVGGMWG